MATINTVRGAIPAESIGKAYAHEHLAMDLFPVRKDVDSIFRDEDEMVSELTPLKAQGINTIIEVTCNDMGRDVLALRRLAERLDLHILCSTGFYLKEYHPAYLTNMPAEEIAEIFVQELTQGIDGTGICAEIIGELGCSDEAFAPQEQKIYQAGAIAQTRTGKPIITHTPMALHSEEITALLLRYGAKPEKVCLGHMDLGESVAPILKAVKQGFFVAFDTIGKDSYRTTAHRVSMLLTLLEKGYAEQILLSEDISRKSYFAKNGGYGYSGLMERFLPELRKAGVDEQTLNQLLCLNVRKFLS